VSLIKRGGYSVDIVKVAVRLILVFLFEFICVEIFVIEFRRFLEFQPMGFPRSFDMRTCS